MHDGNHVLERFASLGACPRCRGPLQRTGHPEPSLICPACDISIAAKSGVVLALPDSDPPTSAATPGAGSGWEATIAADMDDKSTAYVRKYQSYSPASRGYLIRRDLAFRLLGNGSMCLLEGGCGPGVVGPLLSGRGTDVHGVDLSFEQLAGAAQRDPESLYVQANLHALPYRDRVFDAIVLLGVLEYVGDPLAVLREVGRVLRVGGRLILSVPNIQALPRLWTQYLYIPLGRLYKRARRMHVRSYPRALYSRRSLRNLLSAAGFATEAVHFFEIDPMPPPFRRFAGKRALRATDYLELKLRGLSRRLLASQFLVTAELAEE